MKKIAGLAAALLLAAAPAPYLQGQEGSAVQTGRSESRWATEVRLRVFEGIREAGGAGATAVTSSYLKYSLSMTLESEDDLDAERQRIRRVFNLADVKLLTEAALSWDSPSTKEVSHVFRINGNEYLVQVVRGAPTRQFKILVFEQSAKDKTSLLDTLFTVPDKSSAVFGFEDSRGKPYFVLLRITGVGGVLGGVVGGVMGGVVGGVEGGVSGGVEKAVMEEFERGAVKAEGDIKPPRLIKLVNPDYPEAARKAEVQGVVILSARTDASGKVVDAMVLRSIPLLDQAAIDAVKQWIYEPMIVGGKAEPVVFTVTVNFRLK